MEIILTKKDIINLTAGMVAYMKADYRVCEEELEYIRDNGRYRKMAGIQLYDQDVLREVRQRTIRSVKGEEAFYTSNGRILNENIEIYVKELQKEQAEILNVFDSLIMAFSLPDYKPELCKEGFIRNARSYRKRGRRKRTRE